MVVSTVNMRLLHRLVVICTTILTFRSDLVAAQLPSPRAATSLTVDPRLSFILHAHTGADQAIELKETIAFIDSLHSAPVCTQLASSKLITDCQLLDDPTEFVKVHPNQVLEDVQNEYALKLAVCEYVGVQHSHSKPPPHCHTFLPSKKACMKSSWLWAQEEPSGDDLCYPKTNKADLTQCLATMQSSPQMWTSYSNARSRAMHICHLSRQHIDKEETLHLYKNLTRVVSNLYDHVQPLESAFSAMEDRLHAWSDETQQFQEESQQTAQSFTRFAQEAHEKNQAQLYEANQSLRSMQQQVDVFQEKIKGQYESLHSDFEARMKYSLAKGTEVVAYNQADALAQFTKNMGLVYQSLTQELFGQFERYNAELQDYHDKNMLAIQQQHESQLKSFDILQTGIRSVTSSIEYLEDKTSILETELNITMVKINTVNDGLGTLASMAQTAGQLMNGFDTVLSYIAIAGIMLGLALFAGCISRVPLVGNAYRNFVMTILALLVCVTSLHAIYHLLSIPDSIRDFFGFSGDIIVPGWCYFWLRNAAYIGLTSCSVLSVYVVLVTGPANIFPRLLKSSDSSSQPTPLPEQNVGGRIPFQAMSNSTLPAVPPQVTPACTTPHLILQEVQVDLELRDRIRSFRRASTVA